MAQFARPDSDVTVTSFTGGFSAIDEATASNADFAYGANNTASELEVGLSNVTDPAASTGHIFRYRIAKTNAGLVDGGGSAVTVTARLMQGTTQIATDTAKTATGTWTQYAYTLSGAEADAITDYADLRLEFVTSASGGSPANRRGGAVSWAEMEVPDAGAPPTQYNQAIAATSSVSAVIDDTVAFTVALAATATVTAAVARVASFLQVLAATTTVAASFTRHIAVTLSATSTVVAAFVRRVALTVGATTSVAASMAVSRVTNVTLAAATTVAAAVGTAYTAARTLAATSVSTAALATQWIEGSGVVRRFLRNALALLRK